MRAKKRNRSAQGGDPKPKGANRHRDVARNVTALVEPICEAEGLELVLAELVREAGGRVLRLFIDGPGGITLDDCARVSRHVDDLLDVALDDFGAYRLEVSSPGIQRPLTKPADFDRFKDRGVHIRLETAVDGRRNFKGVLRGTLDHRVMVEIENETVMFDREAIAKARLTEAPSADRGEDAAERRRNKRSDSGRPPGGTANGPAPHNRSVSPPGGRTDRRR